jgi:hypothetical protein
MSIAQTELRRMAYDCASRIEGAVAGEAYFETPYKQIVVDGFFDNVPAAECLRQFPPLDAPGWKHANGVDIEIRCRTTWGSEFDIPEYLIDAVRILNSAPVLRAMGDRLGVPKLIPDPYFSGGGLNVTLPGGLLDVHVDGNCHDATSLNGRVNAIVFMNPAWQRGWGGEFGLYDGSGVTCLKRVEPLFNRLVVFDSHDFSFHGLPEPLSFPVGPQRRSIIPYYYTQAARPTNQVAIGAPHSALWIKRKLHDKRGNKTRTFI